LVLHKIIINAVDGILVKGGTRDAGKACGDGWVTDRVRVKVRVRTVTTTHPSPLVIQFYP
jgi:hypothetical protein